MIAVYLKERPGVVFAVHNNSQTETVSEAYASAVFGAVRMPFGVDLAVDGPFDPAHGVELDLGAGE